MTLLLQRRSGLEEVDVLCGVTDFAAVPTFSLTPLSLSLAFAFTFSFETWLASSFPTPLARSLGGHGREDALDSGVELDLLAVLISFTREGVGEPLIVSVRGVLCLLLSGLNCVDGQGSRRASVHAIVQACSGSCRVTRV